MPKKNRAKSTRSHAELEKCRTGIRGLDEITSGGLPRGRPTLVCGGPGCGKTLLAMEFLVRGIRDFGEPGVFMSFEEKSEELVQNVASLGFDLESFIRSNQLSLDYVHVERSEIMETGEYNLEGLFLRLESMIQEVSAKRVAIDTIEALFGGIPNEGILRAEIRRLLRWLKDRGVTSIITGEQGERTLTRHGLEEYVSDCVIYLDNRVINQTATRRLRVVKYRGSAHGANEYPTMIDEHGLSILPVSSLGLDYTVSSERVSSGIDRLDAMLGGKGYFKGSSILVSGAAGSGKSSTGVALANDICRRGGRCLYFAYEEAPSQIIRNMSSIGFDLEGWVRKDRLRFQAVRPTAYGLEEHLLTIHKLANEVEPEAVIMDPITNLVKIGEELEVRSMLTRVIEFLKRRGVTALFTSLTSGASMAEESQVGISSIMDTWLLLRNIELGGERNRLLFILKSRGMAHSNQVREFLLANDGIHLKDVYVGPGEVLTGAARLVQETKDMAQKVTEQQSIERRKRELQEEQLKVNGQLEALQLRIASLKEDMKALTEEDDARRKLAAEEQLNLSHARQAD